MESEARRAPIWPLIPYDDKPGGLRFLVEAFGFAEALVVPDDSGGIVHAELRWPLGGGVMLGTTDPASPFGKPRGSAAVYLVTDSPDALFERAVVAGAEVLMRPYDQDHGSRDFSVRDPEGNTFSFGTYAGS